MTYRIIKNRNIFLSISGALVVASIIALFTWGLNFGVDFTGGSLLEAEFKNYQPTITELQDSLKGVELNNLTIQSTTDNTFILRFKEAGEATHQEILSKLGGLVVGKDGATFKELRLDSVGPSIGQELKSKSFNASIIVLIMIIFYISMAFRGVSKPISSWKYGVAAIIALAHDVIITLGAFAVLGHFYSIEINTPFIAAILTVLGYSVSDTIVVFDRVRENLPKSNDDFENTINACVNQTMARSINTSSSAMLALLAILIFGGSTIKDFSLALLIGIFVGTYSSIFIASPILVIWNNFMHRKAKKV
jgi:preprotein translocase subunit SecF